LPVLAGRSIVGQAWSDGTLAGLQNASADEGFPGMDTLRHRIRQESFDRA
jgi:hypothetical protein